MFGKIISLVAAEVVVFSIGYNIGYDAAPKEILDEEVTHPEAFTVDTQKVLSATVESLKAEAKLVSYKYVGTANVAVTREFLVIFEGPQRLTIPATVSYYVDLKDFTDADVTYDAANKQVLVTLPKLMLDTKFHPEQAIEINTGSLTLSDDVVQALRRLSYKTARKAIIKHAQQAELVRLAKEQTIKISN